MKNFLKNLMLYFIAFYLTNLTFVSLNGQQKPFFPDGDYNKDVPTPEKILGFQIGERPIRHHEAILYLKTLSDASPRVKFYEAGKTHENILLCYVIISAEENISKTESIKKNISRLSDPRKLNSPSQLIETTPAIAWMMYSIHGDELSGTDASIQLAYQLAAGEDSTTMNILNELLIGIDPMENPDGRERYLAQMQQWKGKVSNSDAQSIQHVGTWPWGRGNHYLFDLNRDWFILAHPESRARVKAISEWKPQLVVDAHEMGPYDTYLFNPPREPINSNIKQSTRKWWNIFSQDQAKAFDKYGWSYYTREWLDHWYPGYSSWTDFTGAVSLLYEQASTDGSLIKRPDGTFSTFRDAVHRQFISSIANLTTAAKNRAALLKEFYTIRKQAISKQGAFYIAPSKNPTRANRLIERLLMLNIEIKVAENDFSIKVLSPDGNEKNHTFQKGTYIISKNQPLGFLVNAILEFDPRMLTKVLQKERENLEKGKGTHLYEVSSWSMLLAYDVESFYSTTNPKVKAKQINEISETKRKLNKTDSPVAYLCEYTDDRAIHALLSMFQLGLKVRAAKEPFEIDGKNYPRGTLLLRVKENSEKVQEQLNEIAKNEQVDIISVKTLRIQKGPDLGGNDFKLLTPPRIAVLTGPDLNPYNVGATWYLLDYELNQRFTLLNNKLFKYFDLRKYNVLILPSVWRGTGTYHKILGEKGIKKIKDWVSNGGTLIGIDKGAAFLADSSTGISQVRLRRQVLKDLQVYKEAVKKENNWHQKVDSLMIWGKTTVSDSKPEKKPGKQNIKALTELDKRQRLYQPRGAFLQVDLIEDHWLNYGLDKTVPAILYSSYAFLSKKPVQTAGRFAKEPELRLSGLLWPEARKRWAETAYVTREAIGNGQIILFANEPNFRSYCYGTTRILLNSIILGPGLGTNRVVKW